MNLVEEIRQNVIVGKAHVVKALVEQALASGMSTEVVLNDGLIPAMNEVGRLFECGEYYVPEMLVAARAMQSGLRVLQPLLSTANIRSAGKVVIGTVKGDLHDIGKNLAAMMLEGAGFQVIDLGSNVAPAKFADAVSEHKPDIVGLSALLTTTMPEMKATIDTLTAAKLRDQVKIMVGGAPLTAEYAQQVGADAYARDAAAAVQVAKSLVTKRYRSLSLQISV